MGFTLDVYEALLLSFHSKKMISHCDPDEERLRLEYHHGVRCVLVKAMVFTFYSF